MMMTDESVYHKQYDPDPFLGCAFEAKLLQAVYCYVNTSHLCVFPSNRCKATACILNTSNRMLKSQRKKARSRVK